MEAIDLSFYRIPNDHEESYRQGKWLSYRFTVNFAPGHALLVKNGESNGTRSIRFAVPMKAYCREVDAQQVRGVD